MNIPETGFTGIIAFIFGTCIGSFVNVCIHRIPNSTSIIYPPSACPHCNTKIRFYDNIPLLSYLCLRGRCRHCNASISFRYFLVEIIGGGFALATLLNFGFTFEGLIYYGFITILLIISFIDIDSKTIPDVITIPGIPVLFFASFALPKVTYIDTILGILAGGGSLFIVALTYYLLTKKEGMGGGDIKLLAMIGATIGWKGVFFTVFIASTVGTLTGLLMMFCTKSNMKMAVPFGPFLSIGAIIYIFFEAPMTFWYLHMF